MAEVTGRWLPWRSACGTVQPAHGAGEVGQEVGVGAVAALGIRGAENGTDPEAATDATVLAAILIAAGRNDEAEPLLRQAKGVLSGI